MHTPSPAADRRSYADPCGVARALDAVGERWALLVVRELSLGARRFGQLRSGLPGISPNVLSQRLHELEQAGVVERYLLPAPSNTTVYELTEQGRALDPVLQALGRWGADGPPVTSREMSPVSFLRSLRVLVDPRAPDTVFGLDLDGEPFVVRIRDGVVEVERGTAPDGATVLAGTVSSVRAVLLGGADPWDLSLAGGLEAIGDRRTVRRLLTLFRPPGKLSP